MNTISQIRYVACLAAALSCASARCGDPDEPIDGPSEGTQVQIASLNRAQVIALTDATFQASLRAHPNRLVIVVFSSQYCPSCPMALAAAEAIAQAYPDAVCVYSMDLPNNPHTLKQTWQSPFYPTFAFYLNGHLVERIESGGWATQKWQQMMGVLQQRHELALLRDYHKLQWLLIAFERLCRPGLRAPSAKKEGVRAQVNAASLADLLDHLPTELNSDEALEKLQNSRCYDRKGKEVIQAISEHTADLAQVEQAVWHAIWQEGRRFDKKELSHSNWRALQDDVLKLMKELELDISSQEVQIWMQQGILYINGVCIENTNQTYSVYHSYLLLEVRKPPPTHKRYLVRIQQD